VILQDAVDRGEPEAGAFPHGFRGKKGVKNPMDGGFIHPGPRVPDAGFHVASQFGAHLLRGSGVQRDIFRRNVKIAAVRHGLPRIDKEIQEDLFDLPLVHIDRPDFLLEFDMDHDLFLCAAEHQGALPDQLVEIRRLDLILPTHRKGQQLRRQIGPLFHILVYAVDVLIEWMILLHVHEHQ